MREELSVRYDARQSFYGKAQVEVANGVTKLYSYCTLVAKINKKGRLVLYSAWDYSQTTLRHVREFMRQNGFMPMSKAEIKKAIDNKEILTE